MSSREQIKVKRLSPSPKELRKAMKEASKEVAIKQIYEFANR